MTSGSARLVVQTWLGTRLVILLVAFYLAVVEGRALPDMFDNWDVSHFLAIAEQGYIGTDVAFFPGWPLLLRLVSLTGLPAWLGGVLLALVASGLAAWALYRLGGPPAAIAWLLAPTAIFTVVPYTESLFCAAAFWAWDRALAKQWWPAAALAAVAASVRVSGVFLILALAVLAWNQGGRRWPRLAWLLVPTAVVVGYASYLWQLTGSWTAWYDAQATGWARGLTWPWVSFQHTLDAAAPGSYANYPEWSWMFRVELVAMVIGLVVTIYALAKRRWAEGAWVGVQVAAFSISYWFMSVPRAMLLWFPLWIDLGRGLAGRTKPRPWRAAMLGALAVVALALQAVWAWLFFSGRWAG
ncbi:hypothetical protein ATK74_2704 [Propionicimonas paludicola]|uniref:Mannosyltransferase PIG-V n=1 Tax=Propionicimonas paludicola TaxID=185243 RepID=A0A2A9CUM8_9ACTN|nr:hypothetical protein [Propionicimonas paludicola]PFG18124.1 hypothetical protein ATK74_2704 [Propionicimonas paludicola]